MFYNVGRKIKFYAEVICYLGIALSLIGGIWLMIKGAEGYPVLIIAGIATLLFGGFSAWIFSWFIYGFGELIDKAAEIAENTTPTQPEHKAPMRPVFIENGRYEYKGFYILKVLYDDAESWMVVEKGGRSVLAQGLTYKEAVKVIDDNTID